VVLQNYQKAVEHFLVEYETGRISILEMASQIASESWACLEATKSQQEDASSMEALYDESLQLEKAILLAIEHGRDLPKLDHPAVRSYFALLKELCGRPAHRS
jgi:hypothetical protein